MWCRPTVKRQAVCACTTWHLPPPRFGSFLAAAKVSRSRVQPPHLLLADGRLGLVGRRCTLPTAWLCVGHFDSAMASGDVRVRVHAGVWNSRASSSHCPCFVPRALHLDLVLPLIPAAMVCSRPAPLQYTCCNVYLKHTHTQNANNRARRWCWTSTKHSSTRATPNTLGRRSVTSSSRSINA